MLETFIILVLGFALGMHWTLFRVRLTVEAMRDSEQQQTERSGPITARMEKHGDTLYLFEKHTDRFLAQGRTWSEVVEVLQKRFHHVRVISDEQEVQDQLSRLESSTKQ